jgi:hypothetical protein
VAIHEQRVVIVLSGLPRRYAPFHELWMIFLTNRFVRDGKQQKIGLKPRCFSD